MAQTRRGGTGRTNQTAYNNARNLRTKNAYIYDNTARDLQVQRQLEEAPRRQLSNEARKNREKARHMSFGYVAFLIGALVACGMVLINYVQLQAELTNKRQNVARLESELNTAKLANDEEYSRVTSSVNLEEIKRIAIVELGMVYAEEGQIITYTNNANDYMRKVSENAN